MLKEFKEFALKGNVVDLAVAVVIGGAFGAIVASFVADVITPLLGAIGGQPDFSAIKLGPVLIGKFANSIVAFLIVAFVMFLVVKGMNSLKKEEAAAPAEPSAEAKLLTEIRDLLANR